jgi:hypothetical protein
MYEGACFSHIMFKAYQCAINNEKVTIGLNKVVWRLCKVAHIKQSHGQRN